MLSVTASDLRKSSNGSEQRSAGWEANGNDWAEICWRELVSPSARSP